MSQLENILFIDIETVSQYSEYSQAPEMIKHIWNKKYEKTEYIKSSSVQEAYQEKAAIFAEYGKIICISIAYYNKTMDEYRLKSFFSDNEADLLQRFRAFCGSLQKKYIFCGHNIKEFDIPYLCRRFLVNGMAIPELMNFQDKKPWEVEMYDTLQMWKFGDFKNYTSLETLTTIFGIQTSKEDIDGSQVGGVYWAEKNLDRIVKYCQNDVVAVIQLYRRLNLLPLIDIEKVIIIVD